MILQQRAVSREPVGLGRNSARLWFQLCYIQITLNKKKFYDITKPSLSYVDSLARILMDQTTNFSYVFIGIVIDGSLVLAHNPY